nr:uncharacterized protein LOC109731329 [Microcebus murinus]
MHSTFTPHRVEAKLREKRSQFFFFKHGPEIISEHKQLNLENLLKVHLAPSRSRFSGLRRKGKDEKAQKGYKERGWWCQNLSSQLGRSPQTGLESASEACLVSTPARTALSASLACAACPAGVLPDCALIFYFPKFLNVGISPFKSFRHQRSRSAQMRVTRTNSNSSPGKLHPSSSECVVPAASGLPAAGIELASQNSRFSSLRQPGSGGLRARPGVTPGEQRLPFPPLPSHPPFPFHPAPSLLPKPDSPRAAKQGAAMGRGGVVKSFASLILFDIISRAGAGTAEAAAAEPGEVPGGVSGRDGEVRLSASAPRSPPQSAAFCVFVRAVAAHRHQRIWEPEGWKWRFLELSGELHGRAFEGSFGDVYMCGYRISELACWSCEFEISRVLLSTAV